MDFIDNFFTYRKVTFSEQGRTEGAKPRLKAILSTSCLHRQPSEKTRVRHVLDLWRAVGIALVRDSIELLELKQTSLEQVKDWNIPLILDFRTL